VVFGLRGFFVSGVGVLGSVRTKAHLPMKRPRIGAHHPDYELELQEALEGDLQALIDQALAAGWSEEVIWPALHMLATNLELAAQENRRTDEAIAAATAGLAKKD